jgi:hypothetical protein
MGTAPKDGRGLHHEDRHVVVHSLMLDYPRYITVRNTLVGTVNSELRGFDFHFDCLTRGCLARQVAVGLGSAASHNHSFLAMLMLSCVIFLYVVCDCHQF